MHDENTGIGVQRFRLSALRCIGTASPLFGTFRRRRRF